MSDFNGDGVDDLAIAAFQETVGTLDSAGAVHVLYGKSPSGLQPGSPGDQYWHQNSPGVENTAEDFDAFGYSLTPGDFNGDGRSDLAIGVVNEAIGTVHNAGAVNVLYGSSGGLQTSSPADQLWHQGRPGVPDSEEENDGFGNTLAAGDFNDDGRDDLAVGVPYEAIGALGNAGAVHVLYGSSTGLQTNSPATQLWTQNSPGLDNDVEAGDSFGDSLTTGDFNGDGIDDLAIGVPGEGIGTQDQAGAFHIIYGSTGGLRTAVAGDGTGRSDQFWHQGRPNVEETEEAGDRFGAFLYAADFNGDNHDDVAISIPGENVGTVPAGGAVQVMYGTPTGLQSSSPDDQIWDQDSNGIGEDPASNEAFGASLTGADFNNDGFADLAIGIPGETLGSIIAAGAVHVIYGSSSGLDAAILPAQIWTQNSVNIDDTSEGSDGFGGSLTVGDFNDDGFKDLAVGSVAEDIGNWNSSGAVNVIYGGPSRLQTSSPADQFWTQDSSGVEDAAENQDYFGRLR